MAMPMATTATVTATIKASDELRWLADTLRAFEAGRFRDERNRRRRSQLRIPFPSLACTTTTRKGEQKKYGHYNEKHGDGVLFPACLLRFWREREREMREMMGQILMALDTHVTNFLFLPFLSFFFLV